MSSAWNFAVLPPHLHYAIGVDGGGTSTRARVVHRSGVVVGEGRAGPSGLMQGVEQAWRHIGQAIQAAVAGRLQPGWAPPERAHCALGLGLAGASVPEWFAQCLAADPGYGRVVLATDAHTALLGAHAGKPGALAIMGTGAVGLALGADGQTRTTGGWGFPSGDEGSGADLGLHAINLTQRAVDGRLEHGPLTRAVLAQIGGTPERLLAWCTAATQFSYATLAPLVFDHEASDVHAARLVERARISLESLLQALDPGHSLPLVVAGSIGQRLVPRLPAMVSGALVAPQGDAMDGALALCFV